MKQPNAWSCYPTVISWLTGIPFDRIIETLGHDGSEIMNAEEEEPFGRAAFSNYEMSLALLQLGWSHTIIASIPIFPNGQTVTGYPGFTHLQRILSSKCDSIVITTERKKVGTATYYHAYGWKPEVGVLDPLTGEIMECVEDPIAFFELLFPL